MEPFYKQHQMKVMINKSLKGKAPAGFDWVEYYRHFEPVVLSPQDFAREIHTGYSFTPIFSNGRRVVENFTEAHHMAFDFDNPSGKLEIKAKNEATAIIVAKHHIKRIMPTGWERFEVIDFKHGKHIVEYEYGSYSVCLDYLMRPESLSWYFSSFAYSTPSSTEEHPKSRVVFIFDKPIATADRFKEVYQALAWMFEQEGSKADDQCSDPLRLYFGSPGAKMVGNWSMLNSGACDEYIKLYNESQPPAPMQIPQQKRQLNVDEGKATALRILQTLADNIRHAPTGSKNDARWKNSTAAGGYVGEGYISKDTAVNLLVAAALANTTSPKVAEKEVIKGIESGMLKPLQIDSPIVADEAVLI